MFKNLLLGALLSQHMLIFILQLLLFTPSTHAEKMPPKKKHTQNTEITKKIEGFGLIPDPMQVNSASGQLTSSAQRAKEEKVEQLRYSGEWSALAAGIRTNNTLYGIASIIAIELGSDDVEGFDPNKEEGLFDGVPSAYHKQLFHSGSSTEAWARRARIEQYLKDNDRLHFSGSAGVVSCLAAGLFDTNALLFVLEEVSNYEL